MDDKICVSDMTEKEKNWKEELFSAYKAGARVIVCSGEGGWHEWIRDAFELWYDQNFVNN